MWNNTVPEGVDPVYYHESQHGLVLAIAILYIFICFIAVGLRFYCRRSSAMGYWWDDWLALLTLPLVVSACIVVIMTVPYGWGRHSIVITNTDPKLLKTWFQRLFIVILLRTTSLATFKCSALFFYIRIFGVHRWLYRACICLGVFICLSTFAVELLHVLRCSPVSGQWSPLGAVCVMDITHFNIVQSVPAITMGFLVLILPIRLVWNLRLPFFKRVAILGVFLLGGFDVLISILRLWKVVKYDGTDPTWTNCELFYWSLAEPVSGLLCCCLVTYGPLVSSARLKLGIDATMPFKKSFHVNQLPPNIRGSHHLPDGDSMELGLPPAGVTGFGWDANAQWSLEVTMDGDTVVLVTYDRRMILESKSS